MCGIYKCVQFDFNQQNRLCCLQEERDARERMLQEQDDAYKRSLEIDRAKVRRSISSNSVSALFVH